LFPHRDVIIADMPEVDVWRVPLDADSGWLPPTPAEAQRAARFVTEPLRRRYLRSHAALRAILRTYTGATLDFAEGEHGKPWLPTAPQLKFNLSHSHNLALVAVLWGVENGIEIGVDVERLRPMDDCMAIAERFFPPNEAAALAEVPRAAREPEFFRRWTRIEAKLKARGIGLYGAGAELDGDWSVLPIDVGHDYTASVAASCLGLTLRLRAFT
jgi:4'-phosphopantetheinyl transferase